MRRRPVPVRRLARVCVTGVAGLLLVALSASASDVLRPRTDAPRRVDAIVVVAGLDDSRYPFSSELVTSGFSDNLVYSDPPDHEDSGPILRERCDHAAGPHHLVPVGTSAASVTCFSAVDDNTRGEARAATRIAREQGWHSLLVLTYWGHVSRTRTYFERCFDGPGEEVFVTDPPQRSVYSRRDALLHEVPGRIKTFGQFGC